MMRSCRFHPTRFFRFVMAPLALISLTFIGAAQQKPAADAITGRVLGDDGNPLVNASVSAIDPEARGPNRINRSTKTDDEGYFRLTKLPPGEYQISANAEGYLSRSP